MRSIIKADVTTEDIKSDPGLRPLSLDQYVGQENVKNNLRIYIKAALSRHESLDHVLLYGPPGLGKTTLANIIAEEMGVSIKTCAGPAIEKPGDIVSILKKLSDGDVLFIDEIHRINRQVEEMLYSAMEDYKIDITSGRDNNAIIMHIDLPKFTLIGATTRAGMLTAPMRDRFGIVERLEFYNVAELMQIIMRSSGILGINISDEASLEIAKRSRGTPRIANRLLRRVRDFAEVESKGDIDYNTSCEALLRLSIDESGFDDTDRNILLTIIDKFGGGPVGLDTLAAAISEDPGTIEDVYEPYLIKNGYIDRTPKGRVATAKAFRHFGKSKP